MRFKLPPRYKHTKPALLVTLSDSVYFPIETGDKCLTQAKILSTFKKILSIKKPT